MKKLLPLTAFAFLALALPAQGEIYRAKFGSSKLTIYGDSTIHKWKVETKVLGGYLSLNADALAEPGAVAAKGKVIVPVRQLKSGKKRMDEVMHAAMNAKTHKDINFTLTGIEVKSVKGGVSTCLGKGTFTINGQTKPATLDVQIKSAGGLLTITGSTDVNMQDDYKIKPPSPKLPTGQIVTKKMVKITFTWVVAQAK